MGGGSIRGKVQSGGHCRTRGRHVGGLDWDGSEEARGGQISEGYLKGKLDRTL